MYRSKINTGDFSVDFEEDGTATQDATSSLCCNPIPPAIVDFTSDEPSFEEEQDDKYLTFFIMKSDIYRNKSSRSCNNR